MGGMDSAPGPAGGVARPALAPQHDRARGC